MFHIKFEKLQFKYVCKIINVIYKIQNEFHSNIFQIHIIFPFEILNIPIEIHNFHWELL